jgi:hypothetical protein
MSKKHPEVEVKPKIGATHPGGMLRLGMKEIAQILPAFSDSIRPIEEPGLAGNALPQEIYQARHGFEPEMDHTLEMQM